MVAAITVGHQHARAPVFFLLIAFGDEHVDVIPGQRFVELAGLELFIRVELPDSKRLLPGVPLDVFVPAVKTGTESERFIDELARPAIRA